MAHYLFEGSMTQQFWASMVNNPHDRLEAVRPLLEKEGFKVVDYYFLVGQNKYYVIFDIPGPMDPVKIQNLVVSNISTGAVTTCTVSQIITSAEMVDVYKDVARVGYRAPVK